MFGQIQKLATSAIRQLRVRSALNPMLWLTGIATPVCLCSAWLFRDQPFVRNVLTVMGVCPIAVTCLGFIYFALTKPDKLQSEEYQIRHETLQLIQQKTGELAINPASLEAIANPEYRLLPGPSEEM